MPEDRGRPDEYKYKHAYMYAHRGDGDTWLQVYVTNIRRERMQRTGKPNARGPLPVIAGSEEAAALLEQQRLATIEEGQERVDALEERLQWEGQATHKNFEAMARLSARLGNAQEKLDAAKHTVIYGPAALKTFEDPENTKLEVVHHGTWGDDRLATESSNPSSEFPIQALPSHWRAHGLSRRIGSIRLLSCGSGDAAPRERLVSYPAGYYGPPGETRIAAAQYLADKMKAVGFVRPRVTGYQGLGLGIGDYLRKDRAYIEMKWRADVSLPEEPYALRAGVEGDVMTDIARRSDVSMVFEPTDPDRRRERLRYQHAYMYAPSGAGDTFEFALEENLRRLAKWIDASSIKPRGPIALLAPNEEVEKALVAARAKRMHELGQEVKDAREALRTSEQALREDALSDGERDEIRRSLDEQRFVIQERSFYLAVAEATRIETLDALTTVEHDAHLSEAQRQAMLTSKLADTKVYIPLYGSAGSDLLTTDRSETPVETHLADISQELAQYFLSQGLAPEVGSFRLISWESADTRTRTKFEANPPGYRGLFSNRRVAPAQYLANKLQEDGFAHPRVTGYQGQGIFWSISKHFVNAGAEPAHSNGATRHQGWGSRSIAPVHALQVIPGYSSNWRRRRDVRKVFGPKRGSTFLCL